MTIANRAVPSKRAKQGNSGSRDAKSAFQTPARVVRHRKLNFLLLTTESKAIRL